MDSGIRRRSILKIAAVVTGTSAVLATDSGSSHLEVSASGGSVRAGETVTVDFEVTNTGHEAVRGHSLVLGPPVKGWRRESIAVSNGQPFERNDDYESYLAGWQWDSIAANESVKASYQLSVPNDVEPGDYAVFGEVVGRDRGSKAAQVTSPPTTTRSPTETATATETETPETTTSTPEPTTTTTSTATNQTTTEVEALETTSPTPEPTTSAPSTSTATTTDRTTQPSGPTSYPPTKNEPPATTTTSSTTTSTTTSTSSVEDGGEVVVSGRVLGPDDEADYDDLVIHEQERVGRMSESITRAVTDDDGSFDYSIETGKPHSISYYHTLDSYTIVQPIDPKPDIYHLGELQPTESRDLGTFQLPRAYPVTVTVIDESESPVQAAAVYVVHKSNRSGTGWRGDTGTDGQLFPNWDSGAIDLRGDCSVEVSPPENNTRFVDKTYKREFTVTGPASIEIVLEEEGNGDAGDASGDTGLPPSGSSGGSDEGGSDEGGSDGPTTTPIITVDSEPRAAFTYSPQGPTVGEEVTFDASESRAPDGSIISYEWDFDDGTSDATGITATHTYEEAGEYSVTVEVTDDEETTTTASKSVTVKELWSITLPKEHVRPVQTVEDTIVDDPNVSETIEDPDMVAGRPTSVLFKLEGQQIDKLSDDETVPLEVSTDTGTTVTSELRGKEIKELVYGPDEEPEDVEEAKILADAPKSKRPPIFSLDAEVTTLTVRIGEDDNHGDSVDLSAGTDFKRTESRALRIGFIEIEAPSDKTKTSGWAYGDDDGRLKREYQLLLEGAADDLKAEDPRERFDGIVDECERYLKRVYPVTGIETMRHPNTIEGIKRGKILGDILTDYLQHDLRQAHEKLADEFNDLDATVAITPEGYFDYHEVKAGGLELMYSDYQPQTAACAMDPGFNAGIAVTVAEEIGHHLEGLKAYPKPLAQRRPGLPFFESSKDRSHARTENMSMDMTNDDNIIDEHALRSTAFDLFDGTFSVLREGAAYGYWGRGRDKKNNNQRDWKLGSFMSYSFDDVWADVHVYQQMLNDSFTPTTPVKIQEKDSGIIPILTGTAAVDENGGIHVGDVTSRNGQPMPNDSGGQVRIEITGPDGSVIESRQSPDSLIMLANGGENSLLKNTFLFALPFPEETAEVTIKHQKHNTETTVNPIEMTLRSAIRSVPDRGFTDRPDDRRQALLETAEALKSRMDDDKYEEAATELSALRSDIEQWVRADYDAAANEPTRDELLTLVDEMRSRTNQIEQSGFFTVPPWFPYAGGAGVLGLGAGIYKYLKGSSETTQARDDER